MKTIVKNVDNGKHFIRLLTFVNQHVWDYGMKQINSVRFQNSWGNV